MSEQTPPQTPQRFGDFEILRELGRGGMGIVYEARQRSLNRKVALKIMAGKLGLTSTARVRFQREAEAAARLHHTNIVAVHATGEEDGTPYYAMELIEGPSLGQVIASMRQAKQQPVAGAQGSDSYRAEPDAGDQDTNPSRERQRPVSPDAGDLPAWVSETITYKPGSPGNTPGAMAKRSAAMQDAEVQRTATLTGDSSSTLRSGGNYYDTAANMIAAVADALDYAHNHGVIHRDIKPSNLLLSPDGRLSVTDFGLARMLEQPGMTLTGEFVGSPLYMSPEQIAAGRMKLDHRTDVYSLGATLYQLLTLQPPFPGQGRDEVIAQILTKEPRRLRQIDKRIPTDLETICLKALEKDPDRRYQTAAQFAEDLRRYANRFAIAAKRSGPVGRAVKWVRRRPAVAALGACVLIAAIAVGVFAYRERELRRQTAFDQAVDTVMNGDFGKIEAAIHEAESKGVSRGEISLLRGQLWAFQCHWDEAIPHLIDAVSRLPPRKPNAVAARAMLAWCCFQGWKTELLPGALADLEGMTPITELDYLNMGFALSFRDPAGALALIDKAPRLRETIYGLHIRGAIRAIHVEQTEDPEEAELAREQSAAARTGLPNHPGVLNYDLFVQLVAASVFDKTGQDAKREEALAIAAEDAQALENDVRFQTLRTWYFHAVGDLDAALEAWRLGTNAGFWNVAINAAWAPYEKGHFDEGLEVLERLRPPGENAKIDAVMAYFLAELANGPERAYQAYLESAARAPQSLRPQTILRLLGRKDEAEKASREVRKQVAQNAPVPLPEWRKVILNHNCGDIAADDLLKSAGELRRRQCEAYYHIGLTLLAVGDRHGAKECFRRAVQNHVYTDSLAGLWNHWPRAFLARMEQDPEWPPWIPVEEPATTQPASR